MTIRGWVVVLVVGWSVIGVEAAEVLIDGKAASSGASPPVAASTTPIPFVVSADFAKTLATNLVDAGGTPQRIVVATPQQAYYRRARDARLAPAWVVDVSTVNPFGVWRVFVDGQTGRVIRKRDLLRYVSGDVFPSVSSVAAGDPSRRRLPTIDHSGYLQGPLVSVDDLTDWLSLCPTTEFFCDPPRTRTCAATGRGTFVYPDALHGSFETCAAFDRFDQVTGFFQLAGMGQYFQAHVGYQVGTGLLASQIPLPTLANVPLLINAFFAPPSGASRSHFAFSDEFDPPQVNDFLRDPTVPRHEFTHAAVYDLDTALNDDLTCIDNCSEYIAALNEAEADYFAVASLNMHPAIVGSQLGDSLTDVARNLDNDFRFPCDLDGEPHDDGRIWGGFLREVRRIAGRSTDSKNFFSLKLLPHKPESLQFADALVALLQALDLPPRKFIRVVESAVRHGLIGATSYDRSSMDVTLTSSDQAWTCLGSSSCDVSMTDKVEGSAAAVINVDEGFGVGLVAYDTFPVVDLTGNTVVNLFLQDGLPAGPGALAIVLDDTPDCSSPLATLPIPQHGSTGSFDEFTLPIGDTSQLGAVRCVGLLINIDRGPDTILIDDVVASSGTRFGPVVVPINAGHSLTLRNHFPAPLGDAHFYYFRPPPGATSVRVIGATDGTTAINPDLDYCGNVSVTGTSVDAEFDNVFLWIYDPSQPAIQYELTPLQIDQHILITGVPTQGKTRRRLARYPLPASPSGIYALSLQGAGRYRAKLIFD
jgi:hypothetical protein